jgi:predicted ArsR family transcriptional regulator
VTPNDLPLWRYPHRAGSKEPTTSKDAADRIEAKGRAAKLRQRVLDWFGAGYQGTADEVAAQLREDRLSIRPRVAELHRQGLLERTGQRHKNASGAPAHVWRLNPAAHRRAG